MKKLTSIVFLVALVGYLLAVPAFAAAPAGPPSNAPEPATLVLMGAGLGAVAIARKIRKKQ